MPYGVKATSFGNRRSAVKTRQSAARAAVVAKSRMQKANKPVRKAYYRRAVSKSSNYSAIGTLARQVRSLQMARYGFKQFQHQHMA